ncbi:MAG: putative quinol monooxygenase, partial [Proteobacteria bacterium]|nr:putative quinol monooxygenase [Pseudomonadota bacterium]
MNVFMVSAVAIASLIASCASTETGSSSMIQSKGVGVNRLVAIGKISVQPGLEDDFKRALPALIKKTQAEYGNLRYYFLQSVAHPESFVSIEAWRDQAAMDSHLKSPAVGDFSN